jgi:hypothetical protein
MRFTRIAGLCLVAMFAVSLVASATASAVTWEQEVGGWKAVAGTEKVESNGTLELIDTATLAGEVAVICTGTDTGSIGPNKYDRIESITTKSCTKVKLCEEGTITAKPVDLPWQTELFETQGKKRDKITEVPPNGQPGWTVRCKIAGLAKTDTCTTVAGSEGTPEVTNKTNGSVQTTFNPTAGNASCTLGNATSGKVNGSIQIFAAGHAIRVQ